MKTEPIWSVSEVNQAVRDIIENSLMPFWLRGEVSNLTIHRSGHVYMSLKDENSQLRVVFFGGANVCRNLDLQNGALVEVQGKLTVYEVRGEYQFAVRNIRLAGVGELQRRFDELKVKLEKEGLFSSERKRAIPQIPNVIGVVTSPTGAAIRDFLQIINRRFPNVRIKIYPAQVQGEGASSQIIKGIEFFNRTQQVDVIVLTRGGGSMEDLWAFNEEGLARAVAASKIPTISAIGHEIDFTICDFVADLRVPTPSAAAELVVGSREDLLNQIKRLERDITRVVDYRFSEVRSYLERVANSAVFKEPMHLIRNRNQQLDELSLRLVNCSERRVMIEKNKVDNLLSRLETLNPQRQLERGYAILSKGSNVIKSVTQVSTKDRIKARLADGEIEVTVE